MWVRVVWVTWREVVCPKLSQVCCVVATAVLALQVFVPAWQAGRRWCVSRVCQLDDVAYGTAFSSILLHKWQLHKQRQWDVQSLILLP